MTAYRSPEDTLRAEVARLTRELAAAKERPSRGRWGWRDKLAAPIILSGFPIGALVVSAGYGGTAAYVVTYAVGFVWWLWALRYARSDR